MKTPSAFAVIALALLALPTPSAAQTASAEVTVKVPVNLTQFGPDVARVRVACLLISDAITNGTGAGNHYVRKEQEIPMSGGQVTMTVSLVFSLTDLDNPVGKAAQLNCNLDGWSTSQQNWLSFYPNSPNPSFKTSSGDTSGNSRPFTW